MRCVYTLLPFQHSFTQFHIELEHWTLNNLPVINKWLMNKNKTSALFIDLQIQVELKTDAPIVIS